MNAAPWAGASPPPVRMATCLQGALLLAGDDAEVADVFCASRLGGDGGQTFGTPSAWPELFTWSGVRRQR